MHPIPKHLRAILKPTEVDAAVDNDTDLEGDLVCACGANEFILLHTGGFAGKGKLRGVGYGKSDGQDFLIIKAMCTSCDTEHLVFDDDHHGWNGYVCAADEGLRGRPRPPLVPWECSKCSCAAHNASVWIIGEGREHALENGEGILTDEDWFEAFGSLGMDIKCVTCEFKLGGWLSHETM